MDPSFYAFHPWARLVLSRLGMAAAAVTRVVRRCEEAKDEGRLDLSSCELTSFPVAVYQLLRNTEVHSCLLPGNLLKVLPKRLCTQFPRLQELQLARNQLCRLPAELPQLNQLQTLDVSHNKFAVFPDVMFQLPALARLDASSNEIVAVDTERLAGMEALVEVNLQDNPLSESVHGNLQALSRPRALISPYQDSFQDMD